MLNDHANWDANRLDLSFTCLLLALHCLVPTESYLEIASLFGPCLLQCAHIKIAVSKYQQQQVGASDFGAIE